MPGALLYEALAVPEDRTLPNITVRTDEAETNARFKDVTASSIYALYVRGFYAVGFGRFSSEAVSQVSGEREY